MKVPWVGVLVEEAVEQLLPQLPLRLLQLALLGPPRENLPEEQIQEVEQRGGPVRASLLGGLPAGRGLLPEA